LSTSFTVQYGARLDFTLSGSGYVGSGGVVVGYDLVFDGNSIMFVRMGFVPANVHQTLPTGFARIRKPPGTYTVSIAAASLTTDANDFFWLMIEDWPEELIYA
jgi:hypothetical protein